LHDTAYWWQLLVLAYRGIRAQRMRAFLSAFGVTVGIAAVLAILAIGEGAREQVLKQVEELGMNGILVRSAALENDPGARRPAPPGTLRLADADRLERSSAEIEAVAPLSESWSTVSAGDREARARRVGTTPAIVAANKLSLAAGRFLAAEDSRQRRAVCVLGADVAADLFRFTSPVGRRVRIGPRWFQVIGVLAPRARLTGDRAIARAHDVNRDAYVPLEAVAPSGQMRDDWPLTGISILVRDRSSVTGIAGVVRSVLERMHRGRRDYEVIVPLELLEQRRRTQRTLGAVLAGIAALSLLVGGVGIMNIMLATVMERTREIGVRRAVGATSHDIALQFLAESGMLTFLGGTAGLVLGISAALALRVLGGWPVRITLSTAAGVLAISVVSGLVFGLYPALKAAAADPIEALRYE
jgi:putative ABC transport system permease protein